MAKIFKKLKSWANYNPPGALSAKGWRLFNNEFKEKARIRFWFKNEFKHLITLPIKWKYESIMRWIRYRTYDRYHIIKTGLPPGYYEIDTLMLNVNFNMLKDFVEVEQAIRYFWTSDAFIHRSWAEKYVPFYYKFYPFRRPDLGIAYFNWAATLDDVALPVHERCDAQAAAAKEVLILYKWWVEDRPARVPEKRGEYDDQGFGILGCFDDDFNKEAEDYKIYIETMNRQVDQEKLWIQEDDDMLVRLIRVRQSLWT